MYNGPTDEIHILDRLAVIYRYRRIVVTVFVLATAAMMIQGYSNIQVYQARAQILIEDERSTAVPGITSTDNTYYEDPEPYYKTQYRILMGRDLTRRVIQKLHLENVPEYNGTAVAPAGVPFVSELKQRVAKFVGRSTAATETEAPKIDETPDESALVSGFIGHVGVSPVAGKELDVSVAELVELARHPKVVGIGETGLDYYYELRRASRSRPISAHIAAARQTGLPGWSIPGTPMMTSHSAGRDGQGAFTLDPLLYRHPELADAGWRLVPLISVSGIVTFKNADDLRDATKVPLDRLLVETDAPYLAPVPYRGKTNEPAFVVNTLSNWRSSKA